MISPQESSDFILAHSESVNVIPVLVIDDVSIAADLAKVLVDSGLPILEVTLRTDNALAVIEKMANVDGAIIAAGTVLNEPLLHDARSAGAQFVVSPGCTDALIDASAKFNMPLLPGANTPSEIMRLLDKGFEMLKFFPAEASGGIPMLKSFASPLPKATFCPTGGIQAKTFQDYLALPNVSVVGGTWLVTEEDIRNRDWHNVAKKAKLTV